MRLGSMRGGRISRRSSARRSAAIGAASSPTCRPRTPPGTSSGASISTSRRTRHDPDHPFAFLATYTTRLSGQARPQHQPLGQALRTLAGDRAALLSLLAPVDRAAAASPLLKDLVDSGDVFQPLAWTPREAHRFLQDVPAFEAAGVVVRVPDWWKDRPRRLEVSVTVGGKPPSTLGLDALLDFSVALTLDGEPISEAEWRAILAGADGLALVRGKWVELDREKLREVLGHWEEARRAARDGPVLPGGDAAPGRGGHRRRRAGRGAGGRGRLVGVVAGEWLATTLAHLRTPEALAAANPRSLRTALRPYQETGCAGSGSSHASAWAPAWPTTWAWARRSRCIDLLLLLKTAAARARRARGGEIPGDRACSSCRRR